MTSKVSSAKGVETDGRKRRTNDSRQKIVDAFLLLVKEGNNTPSAEEIAKAANVGLRTVFRRFNEMELLYRELIIEAQAKYLPQFLKPFTTSHWREQLNEMVDRKAQAYETLMPFRVAAKIHMHQSPFIKQNIERWTLAQSNFLESILPFNKKDDLLLFKTIEVALDFDTWIQLRSTQKLSAKKSKELMSYMLESALKNIPSS
ncbi:MAG: TetR/AcrR family transcriptional regulator [Bermanella sp.]